MPTEVTARLNNLRMAPRKVRLLAHLVVGLPVDEAVSQLEFRSKRAARPLRKLIMSAAANAEHNFKLAQGDLVVKRLLVNSAVTVKRYMPRAFGRAATIRKRSSHVTVTLESRTGAVVTHAVPPPTSVSETGRVAVAPRPAALAPQRRGAVSAGRTSIRRFGRRLFNRRSGT